MQPAELDRSPAWLRCGEIVGIGRVPAGSNATFAVVLRYGAEEHLAIYKPRRGERRLWDFPDGTLYRREVAAYLVSEAIGWGIVPPTVAREGPYGIGSLQVYCEPDEHWNFWRSRKRWRDALWTVALFDLVTNNADRKAEHCLVATDGKLYAIDNGLTFHTDFKNRTVLVEFVGEPIPSALQQDLASLAGDPLRRGQLEAALAPLISRAELATFFERLDVLSHTTRMPRVIPHWELYYGFGE
ncbi:MAG: hypothetical protein KatS3mg061_2856 [Dehalococcoidia bacterium]|nr:MAG: hypothetical protein KatS3mg061_2856 [Dehalococcoidia bacterium]